MKLTMPGRALLTGAVFALLLQACGGGGGGGDNPSPPPAQKYTLSGTVRPAAGVAIDSDVNDPTALYQANDTVADAQPIPNPVTLGGYANQPGSGPVGRSRSVGDVVDVYRVSLLTGQSLNLFIASDGVRNDLDLGLYDLTGQLLDASLSQSRVESLTVEKSGDYLVAVQATRGASNYVLTLGQSLTATGEGLRLSDEFAPGEAVVKFREATAMAADGLGARAQSLKLTAQSQDEEKERNRLLTVENWQRIQSAATTACTLPAVLPGSAATASEDIQAKLDTLCMVKSLARDPDVEIATPNYRRQSLFVPNDPFYATQWHYPQLNLPQAWDLTTGSDVIVAVVDTGVVLSHPDLQGQLVAGYDFISNIANALDGDGIDPDPTDVGDRSNPDGSSSFHGTHVTGTVAAATNNNLGVAGVAFGAKVMPLRAIGRFGGDLYDIEQAVRYAAGLPNDSGTVPPRRADVINLSLGSTGSSASEQATFEQARAAGVVVIAAAGNSRSSIPFYPAAYSGVMAVSAVTIDKTLASYSNFGSWVDVAAPGGNTATDLNGDGKPDGVLSTVATDTDGTLVNDYVIWEGTSMAAPHMAGVVALMKALAPNLTPQDVDSLLISGALTEDLGTAGRDNQFGYGLVNAYQAAAAAANTGGQPVDPTPVLAVSPEALNFGTVLSSQTLTVRNGGSGELTVSSPTEDSGGWLRVTPTEVNASGIGVYTVSVNRTGLADGVYSATLTLTSSVNTVQVKAIMQVANTLSAGAIGQQYVLLTDPETGETVADATVTRQADGSYAYTLRDIPAGTYEIFAGSDSNNNLRICDVGESCGAYLTTNEPIRIEVSADQSGLDFVSSYTLNLADFQTTHEAEDETGLQRSQTRQLGTGQ
ncbi:MAG TPA: S8 family serine peptidase [Candidatus Competibacteraceae bacterium]|nr:S8 family serine peptidase [Candidatus Competibacteraceae bacterium]HRZ05910.1 S8 family serine peptidase [Candidatus Competibacteraceae bacterium]HSA46743.1 S8 family serine peptidase [Candidatus Competibacteraceae bacterium]